MKCKVPIVVLCIIFYACTSNDFFFDEANQEFSTNEGYFRFLTITGDSLTDFYNVIKRDNGEKVKKIRIDNLSKEFDIINWHGDTVYGIQLSKQMKYRVINQSVYDAQSKEIKLETDSNGILRSIN